MILSFLVKDIPKFLRSDTTNKMELTPIPTDFFHFETGINHAKTDGTVLAEYLEGVVDDAFLRDEANAKAYAAWKESLTVKQELPPQVVEEAPKEDILPTQDEAVLGDSK